MKLNIFRLFLLILLTSVTVTSFAWNHSIEFGYGLSHDPNNVKYNNSGFLLSGDMISLKRTPSTFWSMTGSLGQWYSTAPHNKDTTTAALSLALRYYLFKMSKNIPTYLLGSAGPAYLTNQRLGTNTQGSHLAIQTNLGLGIEFKNIDLNLRLVHYSNAGLASPNQGFNILYLLSIGYLF